MAKEYRIKEGIGQYWNKRWEVQEKYFYYENGERVTSWHTVFHDRNISPVLPIFYSTTARFLL